MIIMLHWNVSKSLQLSLILLVVFNEPSKSSNLYGPKFRTSGQTCNSNEQCSSEKGEICWSVFEGCQFGQCMCNPQTSVLGPKGRCIRLRLGGDSCSGDDVCPPVMTCSDGTCVCEVGELTNDRQFCIHKLHKLPGESCTHQDSCIQKSAYGYTGHNIYCSMTAMTCQCKEGFLQRGVACVKRNVGEYGCKSVHHCEGGAICRSGRCDCPAGYHSVAGMSKCARMGAAEERGLGEECNELDEESYCSQGLVCHQCGDTSQQKCLKYLLDEQRASYLTSLSTDVTTHRSTISLIMVVTASIGYTTIR